jgi:CRP-like cAMP-binding protein
MTIVIDPACGMGDNACSMTRDSIEQLLSAHPVLRDAPLALRRKLAASAVSRRINASQLLCGHADRTGHVWIVARGLLHATLHSRDGSPVTVDVLRPGEAFGYLNCWMEDAHTEDVFGLTDAEVVGVPAGQFIKFVQQHRPAAELLLRETAERMRALMRLRAIATEPARERLKSVLTFLYEKMGPQIPMTRQMLAMVAGLTTETVSRSLAPLSRKKIIMLRRGAVEILDPMRLGTNQ